MSRKVVIRFIVSESTSIGHMTYRVEPKSVRIPVKRSDRFELQERVILENSVSR